MRTECVNWKSMLVGTGTALVGAVILCAGAAKLISAGIVGEEWINYIAAAVLVAASFLGGMSAGGPREALISGVGLWVMMIGINAVFFKFEIRGGGETLLAILGGSGAAALLKLRGQSARKHRRKTKIVKMNKKMR